MNLPSNLQLDFRENLSAELSSVCKTGQISSIWETRRWTGPKRFEFKEKRPFSRISDQVFDFNVFVRYCQIAIKSLLILIREGGAKHSVIFAKTKSANCFTANPDLTCLQQVNCEDSRRDVFKPM